MLLVRRVHTADLSTRRTCTDSRTQDRTLNSAGLTAFNCGGQRENKEGTAYGRNHVAAELGGKSHRGWQRWARRWALGLIGMKASEAVGRNPGASTKILVQAILAIAFAEAIGFYALFLAK